MNNKYYAEIIGSKCCVLLNGSIVVKGFNTLKEAKAHAH